MAKTTGALKGFRARSQSFSKAGLAAILSLNFGERELAAMTQRVISPADRAERHRIAGETRVHVDLMGFMKINRGGLGISPPHVHEICEDRMKNGTRRARYGAVKVVQLEGSWLQETLQVNEEKCNGDPLMPPFSSKIIYGLLNLTHFVHSQKLVQQGGHLYDKGEIKIRLRDDDEEGKLMGEYGPLTIMYSAELLKDTAALEALMREDNENANITLREDTMAGYGIVDKVVTELVQNNASGSQPLTDQDCLKACKTVLHEARFTEEMLLTLIRFRFRLTPTLSEVFLGT